MATERIDIEPAVLLWARESLGLDAVVAAKRIGVSETTLSRWEEGDLRPTINQLRKAAKVYKRPLAVLLLSRPPEDFQPLRDYRRSVDARRPSPELIAEVRRAQTQREVLLEIADVAPDAVGSPRPLPSSVLQEDPEVLGARIRQHLKVTPATQAAWTSPHEALREWIAAVEATGALVMQTRGIDPSEAAGFSIAEWPFPVVALNGGDWPRRRVFTLLHELAHLALRAGGMCDLHESPKPASAWQHDDVVEHFCNQVAGAALMPKDRLVALPAVARADIDTEWQLADLKGLADRFVVSTESMLLRLVTLERASWPLYWQLKPALDARYAEARDAERTKRRESTGGPSYYVVKARDLGGSYVRSVLEAYESRAISSLDVAHYLDVKYNKLAKLAEVVNR